MGVLMLRLPENGEVEKAVYLTVARDRVAYWEKNGWQVVGEDPGAPSAAAPPAPKPPRFNGLKFYSGTTGE